MRGTNNKYISYAIIVLLLVIVGIGIGYAALSTTLNINGTSNIAKATWDVHFENVRVTAGSVSATKAAVIDANTTSVSYDFSLTIPGQFYEFTVDVKNGGTIPAKLSAVPTLGGLSAAQDIYTNYTVTYSDGTAPKANDALAAGTVKAVKVRVEYDKNITASQLPTAAQVLALTYSMNYIQG